MYAELAGILKTVVHLVCIRIIETIVGDKCVDSSVRSSFHLSQPRG